MRTNIQFSQRLVEAIQVLHEATDRRTIARYFTSLVTAAVPSAELVGFHVKLPKQDLFATLGVYGYYHRNSTMLIEPESGYGKVINRFEPLWARSPGEVAKLYDFPDDKTVSYKRTRLLLSAAKKATSASVVIQPCVLDGQLEGVIWVENTSRSSAFSVNDRARLDQIGVFAAHLLQTAPFATIFTQAGTAEIWRVLPEWPEDVAEVTAVVHSGQTNPKPEVGLTNPAISQREREVLLELASGATNAQIASNLRISINTVRTHRRNLMSKLESHNAFELLATAQKLGLLPQ